MSDINIGEKITQYRKSKGLSIRELAKLANVTPSLLSQIERGLANPSVNSLKSIANALSTPLFTFFTSEVVKEDLIVRGDNRKKVILPGEDNVIYEMLTPGLGDNLEFNVMQCLKSFGRSINYPLFTKNTNQHFSKIHLTVIVACNLISKVMDLAVPKETENIRLEREAQHIFL